MQQLANRGEVAVVGGDDAGIHHRRLNDHAGNLTRMLGQRPGHRLGVIERNDHDQIRYCGGDSTVAGNTDGMVAGADLVGFRQD